MKVKRKFTTEKYKDIIDAFYTNLKGQGDGGKGYIDPTLAGLPQWQALAVAPLASARRRKGHLVFASEAFSS